MCLGVQPVFNVSWQDSKAHSKHSEDVHINGDWILTSSPHFDVIISETAMLCTLFLRVTAQSYHSQVNLIVFNGAYSPESEYRIVDRIAA